MCRLTEDMLRFLVNEVEVVATEKADSEIKELDNDIFEVVVEEEHVYFKPAHKEGFTVDLAGEAVTAADKMKLATSQAPPPAPAASPIGQAPPKSRVTAGVLGILLGGLGIHKFYLGDTGLGIIYLLFFWTVVPAVIGFIEGLIYLFMSDEDFAAKYG